MVSQGVGGHEGYSGTPLWKIQQQNAAQRAAALQESLAYAAERTRPIVPPNVLAEAVSIGAPSDKPLVRHVLVKCLRKVAKNSKVDFPTTGIFAKQAAMGLFALFDGQSCAGMPGPLAAEYCARNFHKKVLENLASLPPACTSETFVKAALVKSFEDLDKDLLETQPDIRDGCGAAVALIIGEYLFSAILGACDGTLCEATNGSTTGGIGLPLGKNQGRCFIPDERARLIRAGARVVGDGFSSRVVLGAGSSEVSRSLGDPVWKPVITCIPEIQSVKLGWAEKHLFLLLSSRPVAEAHNPQELVDMAAGFSAQPRAACGEIATQAAEKAGQLSEQQFTTVEICFLPGGPDGTAQRPDEEGGSAGEAPKKRAKTAAAALAQVAEPLKSARLRHILLRFQDGFQPAEEMVNGKKIVLQSRQDTEALLRKLLREFRLELEAMRKVYGRTRKPQELLLRSERFSKICKEYSMCPTALKGGGMCGDLGWVSREAQRSLSKEFQDAVAVLRPGDWSDIVSSQDGLHIIQRIA